MSTTYRVSFEVAIPDGTPTDDIEEFMRFELGQTCQMSGENKLSSLDLQSLSVNYVHVDKA